MVMLWLFIVLVVIAVAAIIAVLIIDRRSSASSSTRTPRRLRPPWGRRGKRGVELPRRLANSASLFQLPAVRKRIRAQRWLHALLAVMLVSSPAERRRHRRSARAGHRALRRPGQP